MILSYQRASGNCESFSDFRPVSIFGKWRIQPRAGRDFIVPRLISSFHFCQKRSRSRRAHIASTISCNLEGHIDTWLEGCWIPRKSEGASRGYIILRFRSKKGGKRNFYCFYQKGDQKDENKSEIYVAEKWENRRGKEEWSASSNRKQSCLGMYDFTWNR